MEIKGDRPHIFGLLRRQTDIPDRAFVDLVDRHIEADIVGSGVLHMFHDGVVCVAPDGIVACPVTVEAEQDQIRLRQINGEGAVVTTLTRRKPIFLASTTRSRTVRAPSCHRKVSPPQKNRMRTPIW